MKHAFTVTALAALLSVGAMSAASAAPAATAASAQLKQATAIEQVDYQRRHMDARRGHHRILPHRAVIRSLYRRGYRDIRNVRLVRGDYVVRARGYRGQVRLVVDGRTGRIESRHLLRRHWNRPGFHMRGGNGNFSYSFGIR